jgi:hypothetical protein
MAKEKRERQHVFSARTTEQGLRALNDVKARLGIGWDALVIDAVSAHYGLDRAMLSLLPKAGREAKKDDKASVPKTQKTAEPQEAGR